MDRITLLTAAILLVQAALVSCDAVFEVDLLRYEALPNKCCDGYRNVHFGPLKCNECDPYFKICLRELPSGANHCVKTSRENNVHTKDLTNGNIQPNHLSMALQNWKGSMLVDVDIKDFDSVGKDDDIDHLFYTYSGQPDPVSNTVTINGTKVKLTIGIKIYCSTNYFGADCSRHCVNDSKSYCDGNGNKQCKPGYIGAPNCTHTATYLTTTPTLSATVSSNNAATTDNHQEASEQHYSRTLQVSDTTAVKHPASNPTPSTAQQTTQYENVESATTQQIEQFTEDHVDNLSTVRQQDISGTPTTTGSSLVVTDFSTDSAGSGTAVDGGATTLDYSTAPGGDNATGKMVTGASTVSSTTGITTTPKISIPEPLELYSCNLLVLGHMAGVHTRVVSVIYSALSAHPNFTQNNQLGVNAIASTFEVTDNGHEVTDVSYIVNYNGQVLRSETVVRVLTQPPSSGVLNAQLTASNIQRYNPTSQADSSHQTVKKWTSSHLPFVVAMSCVAGILLLIPAIFIVRRLRRRQCIVQSRGVKYDKKSKSVPYTNMDYDNAFSMENPLYDFESNQQPSKGAFP